MRKKNRGKARWCSRRLKTANLMEPSEKVQGFSQVLEAKGVSANCAGGLRCCECLAPGPRGRGSKRSRPPLNVASFPWQAALLRIWKALCPLAPLKKKNVASSTFKKWPVASRETRGGAILAPAADCLHPGRLAAHLCGVGSAFVLVGEGSQGW